MLNKVDPLVTRLKKIPQYGENMARATAKDNLRFEHDPKSFDKKLTRPNGRFFYNALTGQYWDSQQVSIIHRGVDTVKQLYKGFLKLDIFNELGVAYEEGEKKVSIGGYEWVLGSGRSGGYKYSLNNRDLGVYVLCGSFYHQKPEKEGDHLKIELSPHFILNKDVASLQGCIDEIASIFIHMFTYTGVAIHLCTDIQGWQPSSDLDSRLVCRSRRVVRFTGENEIEYLPSGVSRVYGLAETFTFGAAGSLQFTVYNKTKKIAKDRTQEKFWHEIWAKNCVLDGEYSDPDYYLPSFSFSQDVYRIETRFHHSVIKQFALGIGQDLLNFSHLSKHLTALWRYSLTNFRLDASITYVDPFWQYLRDDVFFNHDLQSLVYKRVFKKPDWDLPPSDRTLKIVFGILCGIYRRGKYKLEHAFECFLNSGVAKFYIDMLVSENSWRSVFNDEGDDVGYGSWCAETDIRDLIEAKLFPSAVRVIE